MVLASRRPRTVLGRLVACHDPVRLPGLQRLSSPHDRYRSRRQLPVHPGQSGQQGLQDGQPDLDPADPSRQAGLLHPQVPPGQPDLVLARACDRAGPAARSMASSSEDTRSRVRTRAPTGGAATNGAAIGRSRITRHHPTRHRVPALPGSYDQSGTCKSFLLSKTRRTRRQFSPLRGDRGFAGLIPRARHSTGWSLGLLAPGQQS